MNKPSPIELEFSRKHKRGHAHQYLHQHQDSLANRLLSRRDEQQGRDALRLPTNLTWSSARLVAAALPAAVALAECMMLRNSDNPVGLMVRPGR
jgi:hypothetical protein